MGTGLVSLILMRGTGCGHRAGLSDPDEKVTVWTSTSLSLYLLKLKVLENRNKTTEKRGHCPVNYGVIKVKDWELVVF